MSGEKWFSAKLQFAVMIEPEGSDLLNDCVFLFKANDFEPAFERAIQIGEARQHSYLNTYGQRVQWRFRSVISLDIIQSEDLDGAEIYSEPIHLTKEEKIPFAAEFDPRASEPLQTI